MITKSTVSISENLQPDAKSRANTYASAQLNGLRKLELFLAGI